MPLDAATECRVSNDSNLSDALLLRFPDGRERTVPLSLATRSKTLQDMIDGIGSVGRFTFPDPHGHLGCWLQCLDDMTATARTERRLGALTPLQLVKYLRVRFQSVLMPELYVAMEQNSAARECE